MQDLLAGNAAFARDFDGAGMPAVPARRLAVVACMDARLDVLRTPRAGGRRGPHHFATPGGVITDDVIRVDAAPALLPVPPCKDHIRGFVYDVADGTLHEVEVPADAP